MRIVKRKVGRPSEWIHWKRAAELRSMGFSDKMMRANKKSLDRKISDLTFMVLVNEIRRRKGLLRKLKVRGASA